MKSDTAVAEQLKGNSHFDDIRGNYSGNEEMESVDIKESHKKDVRGKADGEVPKKQVKKAVDRSKEEGRAREFKNVGNREQYYCYPYG